MKKMLKPETICLGFILLSAVVCYFTLIFCDTSTQSSTFLPVSASWNEDHDNFSSGADPMGYLNGKWNLWEFVGDFFSGFIE